jgi:predicted nucleotidyltransferase
MRVKIMRGLENKSYQVDSAVHADMIRQIKSILTEEEKVIFAYLHGSFFKNLLFRDVDVAVFLPFLSPRHLLDCELKLEDALQKRIPFPVDVKALNEAPPAFCYQVIKNGLRLLDRDETKRVQFEVRTLQRYFDFLPYRQLYFQEVLEGEV